VRLLKVENMRKANAKMLYESRRNLTDGLLYAIVIDDGPLDEKVIDAIAESGDECGEQFKRIDAEIKAEGADR
jgi:microsomal dipeptidase-like Zn-dependent dipeptidase